MEVRSRVVGGANNQLNRVSVTATAAKNRLITNSSAVFRAVYWQKCVRHRAATPATSFNVIQQQ